MCKYHKTIVSQHSTKTQKLYVSTRIYVVFEVDRHIVRWNVCCVCLFWKVVLNFVACEQTSLWNVCLAECKHSFRLLCQIALKQLCVDTRRQNRSYKTLKDHTVQRWELYRHIIGWCTSENQAVQRWFVQRTKLKPTRRSRTTSRNCWQTTSAMNSSSLQRSDKSCCAALLYFQSSDLPPYGWKFTAIHVLTSISWLHRRCTSKTAFFRTVWASVFLYQWSWNAFKFWKEKGT